MRRRALVTGGAGFIGSHLVDALIERGFAVRVLDNLVSGHKENLAHCRGQIEFIESDILDLDACRAACEGVDVVFHQAALGSVPRSVANPATTIAVNVSGTTNVFAACRDANVSRVVYASSSSVYGDSDKLPKCEGEEGEPLSPYALSKVMNENLAALFGRCFGMEFVGLRYFNIYGPRQDPKGAYAAVIPRFFAASIAGQAPLIHGNGEQTRDFTYVADAVQANLLAAEAEFVKPSVSFNIACGSQTTIIDLWREISTVAGSGVPAEFGPDRPGDVPHSMADPRAAEAQLGFVARTRFREGLMATFQYYSLSSGVGRGGGNGQSRCPGEGV